MAADWCSAGLLEPEHWTKDKLFAEDDAQNFCCEATCATHICDESQPGVSSETFKNEWSMGTGSHNSACPRLVELRQGLAVDPKSGTAADGRGTG